MSFATDSFTGTDGTVLETYSASWTKIAGGSGSNFAINTNRVYCSTAGAAWQMHYWNAAQATSADYDVTVTVNRAAGNDSIGPAGRLSTNNADGYHVKYVNGSGWALYQRSSNSISQLGSYYNGDDPNGSPKTVTLRMVGAAISVLIGGTVRIGPATGAVTAKGYAGIGSYYTGGTSSFYLDNFDASDPVAAGPTVVSVDDMTPEEGTTLVVTGTALKASGNSTATIGGVAQTITLQSATVPELTVALGTLKFGTTYNLVITDSDAAPSNSFALTSLQPAAGNGFVNVGTPNADTSIRLTSIADAVSGDQVEWENSALVTIYSDLTFDADDSVTTIRARIWPTGDGYGPWTEQTINAGGGSGSRRRMRLGLGIGL